MTRHALLVSVCLLAALAPGAPAQAVATHQRQADPRRQTLTRLSQPLSVGPLDNRVEDVLEMIAARTGADMDVVYLSDRTPDGLDPDWTVTLPGADTTGLELIQRLVAKANTELDPVSAFQWQMTEHGALQIGPRSSLNARPRTVVYDIHDLLFEVPSFDNAPEFDLSSVLSSGSGGASSPFSGTQGGQDDRPDREERADQLIRLIKATVEPEEWLDAGGQSSTITYLPEQLVVTAPDYVHRQIAGYPYWPKRLQAASTVAGRRDVRLLPDRAP